jgi:hypothetical protein
MTGQRICAIKALFIRLMLAENIRLFTDLMEILQDTGIFIIALHKKCIDSLRDNIGRWNRNIEEVGRVAKVKSLWKDHNREDSLNARDSQITQSHR